MVFAVRFGMLTVCAFAEPPDVPPNVDWSTNAAAGLGGGTRL